MELFDAHTHIDMKHYKRDRERVIQRAKEAGLVGMVTSSIGPASFRRTLGIIDNHPDYIYHSAGCGVSRLTMDEAKKIVSLTLKYAESIVAVGEVGLDYHWIKDTRGRKAQEPLFHLFINLASKMDLPIVIHSRKAELEATEILENSFSGEVLMHCFDGSQEVTERIAENGWYITLPANFGKYPNRVAAAKILPLSQILLESDGPYLSPDSERNEPSKIIHGARTLSSVRGQSLDDVTNAITQNAKRFYRLLTL
jgi:TatD DNase family protein